MAAQRRPPRHHARAPRRPRSRRWSRQFFQPTHRRLQRLERHRNDPAKAITFGDGSPLDPEDVAAASALADDCTFDLPWQAGDLALVDNYTAMHGRRTFTGTRKVLASLVAA
jgi:alpha-ketoglutarate-dependent taurine dioxygenase